MLTRFVRSFDGTSLCMSTTGDERNSPLILVNSWTTSGGGVPVKMVDMLANRRFVARYDRRGTGASSRDVEALGLDAQVEDVIAVADALQLDTTDVLAFFDATPIAIAAAARFPRRFARLVLWHPIVDGADWIPRTRVQGLIDLARTDWTLALHTLATILAPRGPVDFQRSLAKGFETSLTQDTFVRSLEATQATSVIEEARVVESDTLILSPSGAGLPLRYAQQTASLIANATLMPVDQSVPFLNEETIALILRFLDGATGDVALRAPTSGTAVILFTDIVSSTELTERMGDAAFRDASRALDTGLREAIRDAGGVAIDGKLLGDGVLATFPSAAQAIDGARRCLALSAASELGLHIGLHAGDVIREEGNVYGGAVNIASRICGLCEPGEVLVSDTVRSLARTSAGVTFEDRGEHALKGVADPQRVYAVRKDGA